MSIRLCRWGNSTGLRLPKSGLERMGLAAGGYASSRLLDNGHIHVRPVNGCVPAEPSICKEGLPRLKKQVRARSGEWGIPDAVPAHCSLTPSGLNTPLKFRSKPSSAR